MGRNRAPRIQRSRAETFDALRTQLNLLSKSCRDYDEGDRDEIVRVAQGLRVLLNSNGRANVSLVSQIGATQSRFFDTAARYSETSLNTYSGLMSVQLDFGKTPPVMRSLPVLDDNGRKLVRFSEWWDVLPAIRDTNRAKFTRRQLVCWMANEDGGSHVDTGLSAAYHYLSRGNALGWWMEGSLGQVSLMGAVDASIRQIAHEALRTFQRRNPELFPGVRYEMYRVGSRNY